MKTFNASFRYEDGGRAISHRSFEKILGFFFFSKHFQIQIARGATVKLRIFFPLLMKKKRGFKSALLFGGRLKRPKYSLLTLIFFFPRASEKKSLSPNLDAWRMSLLSKLPSIWKKNWKFFLSTFFLSLSIYHSDPTVTSYRYRSQSSQLFVKFVIDNIKATTERVLITAVR